MHIIFCSLYHPHRALDDPDQTNAGALKLDYEHTTWNKVITTTMATLGLQLTIVFIVYSVVGGESYNRQP